MNYATQYSFMSENEDRKRRWACLTKGIEEDLKHEMKDPHLARIALEMLYESYVDQVLPSLINVSKARLATMSPAQIQEAIDSTAVASFDKYSLGIYRRTLPKLFAKSLISIQPIPVPDARVFFLDFSYGTTIAGGATAADRLDDMAQHDAYYAGGRKILEAVGAGTGAAQNFDLDRAGAQNLLVYLDGTATTAYVLAAGAGAGGVDQVQFVAPPGLGVVITATYDNIAEGAQAKDIDFSMSSTLASSEKFALRAAMTVETEQDFKAYHGLSAEAELTASMADEMERELDTLILLDIFNRASAGNVNWNSAGFLPGDTTTTYREDYKRTLYQAIVSACNLIYASQNVDPTWMVCGTSFAQRLEQLEKFGFFKPSGSPDGFDVQHRVEIGTLQGRLKCYKCSRVPADQALIGYKGESPFHTGYIWAPFILMYMTKLLDDPNITFNQRKGIMSRGARVLVKPQMYSTVTVL